MIIMRLIHTVLFLLYLLPAFLMGVLSAILISPFSKDKTYLFHRVSQYWARYFVLPLAGIRVKIEGLENIPKQTPVIFLPNHQSYADIPILLAYLPGFFHFIVKREYFKTPILGWYTKRAGHLSVDRKSGVKAQKTLDEAVEILEHESMLVFPEGTRSRDGNLGPLKRGSLKLAFAAGATVLPVGISGSFNFMKKGSFLIYPQKVTIKIGAPISFEKSLTPSKPAYEKYLGMIREKIEELI